MPGLLERSLERGWRAVVQTGTEERRDALDAHLWTFRDDSFLAHATDREARLEEQPVVLTTGAGNPNGAEIRFLVDGAEPPDLAAYARVAFHVRWARRRPRSKPPAAIGKTLRPGRP